MTKYIHILFEPNQCCGIDRIIGVFTSSKKVIAYILAKEIGYEYWYINSYKADSDEEYLSPAIEKFNKEQLAICKKHEDHLRNHPYRPPEVSIEEMEAFIDHIINNGRSDD